jgi:hypothetical protein
MIRRLLAPLCAVLLVAAAPAAAQAPAPGELVAPGVSAAGVDVSGLTVDQAAVKINASFRGRLERNVAVLSAGRRFRLSAEASRFTFDHLTSAKRALYAGRAAGGAPVDVPLALGHSRGAVQRFAARVDRAVSRPARDATLAITLRRVRVTRSRPGRDIDHLALAGQISAALDDPAATRILRAALVPVKAEVNALALRRRATTVVTIDRASFKLRLFKRLRIVKTYGVAVGQPAYPTPTGRFAIQSKQVNPTWSVPNSPWAGELAGTSVDGGSAANPLKARWMGVSGSVGIHGTGQEYSIGSRASHGCIRMRVADVIALFKRVPLGTPVLIR